MTHKSKIMPATSPLFCNRTTLQQPCSWRQTWQSAEERGHRGVVAWWWWWWWWIIWLSLLLDSVVSRIQDRLIITVSPTPSSQANSMVSGYFAFARRQHVMKQLTAAAMTVAISAICSLCHCYHLYVRARHPSL